MDTSIVLHWTAPEDNGGAEITNYVIHCRPETEAEWKPATADKVLKTEHSLTKLKTNVVYAFKVAAVNKVGAGPFSDPSAPVQIKEVVGRFARRCYGLSVTYKRISSCTVPLCFRTSVFCYTFFLIRCVD